MKVENGIYPIYVRNGIMYPIALTQEQLIDFRIVCGMLPQPIRVVKNEPIGNAVNLFSKEGE